MTGAEPSCRSPTKELGARDGGAKLNASINGAELRVNFLNSFRQGSICEKLSKKGLKCKKKSDEVTAIVASLARCLARVLGESSA